MKSIAKVHFLLEFFYLARFTLNVLKETIMLQLAWMIIFGVKLSRIQGQLVKLIFQKICIWIEY